MTTEKTPVTLSEGAESLLCALEQTGKPQSFVLTTLNGRTVWIRQLSPRETREWWIWKNKATENKIAENANELVFMELLARTSVTESDELLFRNSNEVKAFIEKLRDKRGAGKMLAEYYDEACRQNWLFEWKAEGERERSAFFSRQPVKPANNGEPSSARLTEPSTASPPVAAKPTS